MKLYDLSVMPKPECIEEGETNIVIFVPHADDEVIGMYNTIKTWLLYNPINYKVTFVLFSNLRLSEFTSLRGRENVNIVWLWFPDCEFHQCDIKSTVQLLDYVLSPTKTSDSIVYIPTDVCTDQDHKRVHDLALTVYRNNSTMEWNKKIYEYWYPPSIVAGRQPNHYSTYDEYSDPMWFMTYKSQRKKTWWFNGEWLKDWKRSLWGMVNAEYADCFKLLFSKC